MISRPGSIALSFRDEFRRLLLRGLTTQVVAVADGQPVLVQERHARETLGGERGPPTADSFHGGKDLTGVRVWEAAPDLIDYLSQHRSRLLEGRSLLDLGSGTGAVGLAAAAFGAERVVLSDMDSTATFATETGWEERSTLEALAENAVLNGARAAAVSIAELKWGCEAQIENVRERFGRGGFETLTASDVLYYRPDTYGALAATIRALAAADGAVVLAYRVRHGDEHGFVELLTRGTPPFEVVHRGGADARVSPQDRQSGSVKEKWVVELRAPGG